MRQLIAVVRRPGRSEEGHPERALPLLKDQRVEAFASLLWDGIYTYTCVARATPPGHFVVPPARAEEMYSPEVLARSSSHRVVVK